MPIKPKISFCTTVMNRIDHIKITLPQNICDNDSEDIEFLLLDYNSTDGFREWLFKSFKHLLEVGTISYYRTEEPSKFNRSHSRNVAFKLAKGEIICNVDADNFLGPQFHLFIKKIFSGKKEVFLSATSRSFNSNSKEYWITGKGDVLGRIVVKKSHFLAINGYDESFIGYGFEDSDIINRLEMYGLKRKVINNYIYLKTISHTDNIRLINEHENCEVFVHQESFYKSICLFLYQNGEAFWGTVIDNNTKKAETFENGYQNDLQQFQYTLEEMTILKGRWEKTGKDHIKILVNENASFILKEFTSSDAKILINHKLTFYKITQQNIIDELILFKATITNRYRMIESINKRRIKANEMKNYWGKAIISESCSK